MAGEVLNVVQIYAYIGIMVALFLIITVDRFDEAAKGAYLFRILIFPGAALLWPLVLWRLQRIICDDEDPFKRHKPLRLAKQKWWLALLLLLPVLFLFSMLINETMNPALQPVKLMESGS